MFGQKASAGRQITIIIIIIIKGNEVKGWHGWAINQASPLADEVEQYDIRY